MNTIEKHKILKDWMIKNYNQPPNRDPIWLYHYGNDNILILLKPLFLKWQALLKKGYTEDQLIDYFIEIVRVKLPELKGTKLCFSLNPDDMTNYKII